MPSIRQRRVQHAPTIYATRENGNRVHIVFRFVSVLCCIFHLRKMADQSSNVRNPIDDRCRLCHFVFFNKKRKRNLDGEFLKIFEYVCGQKVSENDGLPHAVCDTCRYRVQKAYNDKRSTSAASKRKHPVSPLTSSQGDDQTVSRIEKKKGFRIPFENVPMPINVEVRKKVVCDASSQTLKSSCQCTSTSRKGTSIKVYTSLHCKQIKARELSISTCYLECACIS